MQVKYGVASSGDSSPKGQDLHLTEDLPCKVRPRGAVFSIDTFRQVAREVANRLGFDVAICSIASGEIRTYRNKPFTEAKRDGDEIIEVVSPDSF